MSSWDAPGRVLRSTALPGDHGRVSTTTRPRSQAPRTTDPAPRRGLLAREPLVLTDAATGVVTAVQALVLSLAVVVLLAVTAYLAATGASTTGDEPQWGRPVAVATGLWLLGHGVPLTASGVSITFVPLGIGALALFTCYASAKRSARATWVWWAAATVTYTVGTTAAALLAGTAGGWAVLLAPLGGALLGGAGFGAGLLVRPEAPRMSEVGERAERLAPALVPAVLRLGARGGLVATALLVGAAGIVVAAWAVAGRATSSDIVTALAPGWAGGIVLAIAQLAILPDLVLWAVGWLAGPGFAVGTGTRFSVFEVESGPLPALPLLGALPGPDWANPVTAWVPVAVVACGVVAGLFVWRRLDPDLVRWSDVAWSLCGVAGAAGVVVGVLQWIAGGSAGPGRLADVGADPLLTGALVAAEVGGGAGAVIIGSRLDLAARRRDLSGWLADRRDRRTAAEAETGAVEPAEAQPAEVEPAAPAVEGAVAATPPQDSPAST